MTIPVAKTMGSHKKRAGGQSKEHTEKYKLIRRVFYTGALLVSILQISSGVCGVSAAPFIDAKDTKMQVYVVFAIELMSGAFLLAAILENHSAALNVYMLVTLYWLMLLPLIVYTSMESHDSDSESIVAAWIVIHIVMVILVAIWSSFVERLDEIEEEVPEKLNGQAKRHELKICV